MNDATAKRYLDRGQYFRLYQNLQRELPSVTGLERALVLYHLSIIARGHLGYGVDAKRWCDQLCREYSDIAAHWNDSAKTMFSNALANAMLLSLSFEEYETSAGALRKIGSNDPILAGQFPPFMKAKDAGQPWSQMMIAIAESYITQNRQMYAEAVSTYQLLLKSRRQLRLDRATWGRVIDNYGTLCLRLGSTKFPQGSVWGGSDDPDDPRPLVSVSTPYIEEYLRENPNDSKAKEKLDWQEKWFARVKNSHRVDASDAPSATTVPSTELDGSPAQLKIRAVANGVSVAIIALMVSRYLLSQPMLGSVVISVASGLLTGLLSVLRMSARTETHLSLDKGDSSSRNTDGRLALALSMRRNAPVLCSKGHEMRPFEDDGCILARCPQCDAVKPFPGAWNSGDDILRVAGKYPYFEM